VLSHFSPQLNEASPAIFTPIAEGKTEAQRHTAMEEGKLGSKQVAWLLVIP
jgi:hypothetical protein